MKKSIVIVFLLGGILFLVCTPILWGKFEVFKKERRLKELSSEFQPLLSEVKDVMEAKILIEDEDNPLSYYSLDQAIAYKVARCSAGIKLKNVICKNNVWYIKVTYSMSYEDRDGNLIRSSGGKPTWKVEKRNGKWEIIERCGRGDIAYDEEWEEFWSKYGG